MKTVSLYLANTERVHNLVKECGVSVQFNIGKPSVVTGSEMCVIDFLNEYFRGKPIARHFIQEMRDVLQAYEFYPEICERYETILSSVEDPDTSEIGVSHLLWMLNEIQDGCNGMSETKRHRWLGYIQGVMVMKNLITVNDERNATRPVFNGA